MYEQQKMEKDEIRIKNWFRKNPIQLEAKPISNTKYELFWKNDKGFYSHLGE